MNQLLLVMNCFNHPQNAAVSSCPDCNKGLCLECSQKYTLPICSQCNQKRISQDKKYIYKDFVMIFGGGFLLYLFNSSIGKNENPLWFTLILFYCFCGLIAGWRFLNNLTPQHFLFLPIIGWLIYFAVKYMISGLIGWAILPYRIYTNTKRLKELNKIPL